MPNRFGSGVEFLESREMLACDVIDMVSTGSSQSRDQSNLMSYGRCRGAGNLTVETAPSAEIGIVLDSWLDHDGSAQGDTSVYQQDI